MSAITSASVQDEDLRKMEGVTLFNKGCSSGIRKFLNIKQLPLRIERFQLRWFGHVSRMHAPNKHYMPKQMEKDQLDDLKLDIPITLRILDGIAGDFTQER